MEADETGAPKQNNGEASNMDVVSEVTFDNPEQQRASNDYVHLIRKLRWMGMDDEAEQVLDQLSGRHFRPTETALAGPWATD
jgi:hypothetical protein